jgi:hypothetical protein
MRLVAGTVVAERLHLVRELGQRAQLPKQDNVPEETRKKNREIFTSTVYETEHPLVRDHPVAGERSLVLGHFFKHFVGWSAGDSAVQFRLFQDHITRPENTVRWRWAAGGEELVPAFAHASPFVVAVKSSTRAPSGSRSPRPSTRAQGGRCDVENVQTARRSARGPPRS